MHKHVEQLRDITIHPFYRDIPIEVEPVVRGGSGRYTVGHLAGHDFCGLDLDSSNMTGALHIGATYSGSGISDSGARVQTHWLYCTGLHPAPRFGITRNWSRPDAFAPLCSDIEDPLIRLEELTDLVAIFPSPPPAVGHAQAQIGRRGWLVMTRVASPHVMGIEVEDPTLPPHFPEGAGNIMVSAKCTRTLQSVGFDALTCVRSGDSALLLRREM